MKLKENGTRDVAITVAWNQEVQYCVIQHQIRLFMKQKLPKPSHLHVDTCDEALQILNVPRDQQAARQTRFFHKWVSKINRVYEKNAQNIQIFFAYTRNAKYTNPEEALIISCFKFRHDQRS